MRGGGGGTGAGGHSLLLLRGYAVFDEMEGIELTLHFIIKMDYLCNPIVYLFTESFHLYDHLLVFRKLCVLASGNTILND